MTTENHKIKTTMLNCLWYANLSTTASINTLRNPIANRSFKQCFFFKFQLVIIKERNSRDYKHTHKCGDGNTLQQSRAKIISVNLRT